MLRHFFIFLVILSFGFGFVPESIAQTDNFMLSPENPTHATQLVADNTEFAFDLLRVLMAEGKGKNIVCSPESISIALAMTYAGAKGQTESEMAKAMHFTLPQNDLHLAYAHKVRRLNTLSGNGIELSIANSLWAEQTYKFLPNYMSLVQNYYEAPVTQVDFVNAFEPSRLKINDWVERKTHQKIKDLLPEGILTDLTRLVLVNAVYYKGQWKYQFDKKYTRERTFFVEGDRESDYKVQAPFMYQKGTFKNTFIDEFEMLELPYLGESLSFLVLLPGYEMDLSQMVDGLSSEKLSNAIKRLRETKGMEVIIPKFKATGQFELKKALYELGMKQAFTPKANLSGMDGRLRLYIDAVVHKAFLEVNEEGSEAAAATGVVVNTKSMAPRFIADRPFLALIRVNATGGILFAAVVQDPSK